MRTRRYISGCCLLLLSALLQQACAQEQFEPAKVKVSGYGLIRNLDVKRSLVLLTTGGEKRPFFDADFIEDAALILISRLNQDGYLKPLVTANVTLTNGQKLTFGWRHTLEEPLPRPLAAKEVRFHIEEGTLYYYRDVQIKGLKSIPLRNAVTFFRPTGSLIPLKRNRVYSPERLRRSQDNLRDVLERQGYRSAAVRSEVSTDDRTGAVNAIVIVDQGPKSIVRSVQKKTFMSGTNHPELIELVYLQRPYSSIWEQDFSQSVKTNFFRSGFPDVTVSLKVLQTEPIPAFATEGINTIYYDLEAEIRPGPLVTISEIQFEGQRKTKTSVLLRRVELQPGQILDRIQTEQSRFRLSRLGIFDSVGLRYEPVDEHHRNVSFQLDESKTLEAYLLASIGSYELLRLGFAIDQNNIWGLAHNSHLLLSQSFKTSLGDYIYTIPEVFGEDINLFFDASALRREEASFTREEYGGGVGMNKYFREVATDLSARYDYRLLSASQTVVDPSDGLREAQAGAFIIDVRHDRRDNPLYPHHGYKLFGNTELASRVLGGDVDYRRFEFSSSYHFPVSSGQWLHFALDHGFVVTDRGPRYDLPFNRRFFPGGETSIRGYPQGEAAPRNEQGVIVGAESFLLGTAQFEQQLTPKLALMLFIDSVGLARRIADYPLDEVLTSVGGGLAWRTIIGPIRVEYGYNLDPRPDDPTGTIQFSVGFPF